MRNLFEKITAKRFFIFSSLISVVFLTAVFLLIFTPSMENGTLQQLKKDQSPSAFNFLDQTEIILNLEESNWLYNNVSWQISKSSDGLKISLNSEKEAPENWFNYLSMPITVIPAQIYKLVYKADANHRILLLGENEKIIALQESNSVLQSEWEILFRSDEFVKRIIFYVPETKSGSAVNFYDLKVLAMNQADYDRAMLAQQKTNSELSSDQQSWPPYGYVLLAWLLSLLFLMILYLILKSKSTPIELFYNLVLAPFVLLYRYRHTLWATTWNDIKGRFAGMTFGLLWAVFYPLIFLGLYAVVFTVIFQVRLQSLTTIDYVLLIFAGLIPFIGLADALGFGVPSVVANKPLVKNTLFPIELIPVKAVFVGSVTMLVGLIMLLIAIWSQGHFYWTQLILPFLVILQLMFTIGTIWILSALSVFFKDIQLAIPILILFNMLISPIAYTIDMIPPNWMIFFWPNPLFYIIMSYRAALVEGYIHLRFTFVFAVLAVIMFLLGYYIFSRLKALFADYV